MGQVNCQCQEIRLEDHDLGLIQKQFQQVIPIQENTETKNLLTRVTLTNSQNSYEFRIQENQTLTVGCGTPCQYPLQNNAGNAFKMTARMSGRALMLRDCGIGFGVFIVRKRIALQANNQECFLSIEDSFVMLRINQRKVVWTIFDLEGEKSYFSEPCSEIEIKHADTRLSLRRSKQFPNQYTLRRQDRRQMCMLLTEQQRAKPHQTLRLGCEYFKVQGICTCIDATK